MLAVNWNPFESIAYLNEAYSVLPEICRTLKSHFMLVFVWISFDTAKYIIMFWLTNN
jgi:hypothetical protein